ncbi:MAG: phosphotransferase [Bacteroidota bacterium]
MQLFPVSSSILSSVHLTSFLQEQFNFSNKANCGLIKAGVNHNYLVQHNTNKYIYRVYCYNWRTEKEILAEISLLNHLQNSGIDIAYPIADKAGNFIQVFNAPEGKRFGVLFSYAEGEKQFTYTTETHFAIGAKMAQIHTKTTDLYLDRPAYNAETLLVESMHILKDFIALETEEMKCMQTMQHYLLKEYECVNISQIRKGVVHLDIWFDNLHIAPNNKITIYDFDLCGNGWICLDIAYYMMQLYTLEPDETIYTTKMDAFIEGYESVTKISDEEKRILPMLGVSLYFYYLGLQCQRFEDYSSMFINETYLKRYIVFRVKKYFDYHQLGLA